MLRKSIAMTLIMSAVLGLAGASADAAIRHRKPMDAHTTTSTNPEPASPAFAPSYKTLGTS